MLLAELESDRVERKQSFRGDAPTTVREAVCAFANDMPGHGAPGAVFIGARDDGSPLAGFEVTDELLRQLADIKTDGNIAPPPSLLVEKRHLAGADFAVITVWPCDTPPARYKGRIHVRWGPRRGLASAQDERILNERRRHRDRPYDIQPVRDATLDELDRLRFESRVSAVAHRAGCLRPTIATSSRSWRSPRWWSATPSPCPPCWGCW
ncbi:MAG: putative DNA binding domain-containing protein [Burkholderiaceae bacterium]|nr:putative DNA binding domain-containing protein [Burkholderiaceae bacterium]